MATFLGLHNQKNTPKTSTKERSVPLWKQLAQGVVSSVKEKINTVLSLGKREQTYPKSTAHSTAVSKRELIDAKPSTTDIGNTSLHISPEIRTKSTRKGLDLRYNDASIHIALDENGELTEDSQTRLREMRLTHTTSITRTDFAHRQRIIQQRRRILAPGNIKFSAANFPQRQIIQIEYQLVHAAIDKPTAFLITLDNTPGSPTYSFPVEKDAEGRIVVNFPSDAPKGSLERAMYDSCFRQGKAGIESLFHRGEFVSDALQSSNQDEGSVLVHAHLHNIPKVSSFGAKESYPSLDIQEYKSISIAPLSFPKLNGAALETAKFERLFHEQKIDGILDAWRIGNPSVFIENLSEVGIEILDDHTFSGGYLQEFYARFISAKKRVTPALQAWVLEKLPLMSVSQLHALINFDELLRQEKLGRLFPVHDELLTPNIERKESLRTIHKSSLDINLLLGSEKLQNNKGMLMGDVMVLYPMFHSNILEQKAFVDAYFLNQSPPIPVERWVSLVNNAEQHFAEFQLIQNMTEEDYAFLEETSGMFQELYQDRMRLKTLMETYAFNAPDHIWKYLAASFNNTLSAPLVMPQLVENMPLLNECLKIAATCQGTMSIISSRVDFMRQKLSQPKASKPLLDDFPVPYSLHNPQEKGKNVEPEILKREMHNWIALAEVINRSIEGKNFQISEYNKSMFRTLVQRAQVIIGSFQLSTLDPFTRKNIMWELYGNFMTSTSNPMLLALYLEMFLLIVMQEKSFTTFTVTQVMLRKYITQLPASKKKEEITKIFQHIQTKSRISS